MNDPSIESRLSQISTQWTLLFEAHADRDQAAGHALLAQLVQRYCSAVYRYLLAAVRDADVAADLAQEFALRFLQGQFRRANPDSGRFRSYVKTVLFNLVADHRRARLAAGRALVGDVSQAQQAHAAELDEDQVDIEFLRSWRETLLERTWRALEQFNPSYHAALRLRVANPAITSGEMAKTIAQQLEKPMNAAAARKALERGHAKFADLLVDEVAATLADAQLDQMEDELRELDLLRYCRSAIERRRQRK
jgi:RNA polymerase sigma-70 factor (ECF subfamily)